MAWRSVMIQNPAKLSLNKGQLKLQNADGVFTLPLEDITSIILESPQIILSSALLAACQEQAITLLTCDHTHMPNGVLLPFQPHSRQSRVAHMQIAWTEAQRNRLWQRVVQTKIRNQAACLKNISQQAAATHLNSLASRVKTGDPKNIEAQAARAYWTHLMGKNFRRGDLDSINAALNYGYAIIRAYVARSQVSYGLFPTFGIHHNSQVNAFNLTDDMMEVFRPFVDCMVHTMKRNDLLDVSCDCLSNEIRSTLATIGAVTCKIENNTQTIANACDKLAASLVNAIEGKNPALLSLPEMTIQETHHENIKG